jgi:type II secretory ATPase GspE/PulE/Tfp pilus assembly ATPase PilB-like protein
MPSSATSYKEPLRLWQRLLDEAVMTGASDVHVEPGEGCVRLFLRLDGVRHALMVLPSDVWGPLVSCLKVMCQSDVTVTRLPQQGRMTREVQGKEVDFRCTTHPTLWGEKVVVRILAPSSLVLAHLGFSATQVVCLQTALQQPQGLVVVSGPTGSGKTTTLHAMTRGHVKKCLAVLSLEDPPEYRLPGVMQTAVSGDGRGAGLSFEEGVASALRQDIDVLLLGEVRSAQAAHMAVRAAMTGHQVLTSVHTSDALMVIDRLIELGVSPHYVAAYVALLVNQRLVRLLCTACKARDKTTGFYRARGCAACAQTGYRGRTVLAQVVSVDAALKAWILRRGHSEGLFMPSPQVATLADHAHAKLRAGSISLEECYRVLGPAFVPPDVASQRERKAA